MADIVMLPSEIASEYEALKPFLRNGQYVLQKKLDGKHFMLVVRPEAVASPRVQTLNRMGGHTLVPDSTLVTNFPNIPFPLKLVGELVGEALGYVFHVFDVLDYRGVDMMNRPLHERLDALPEIAADICAHVPALQGRIVVTPSFSTACQQDNLSPAEIEANNLHAAGAEGFVLKRLDSRYIPGRSRAAEWIKFKWISTVTVRSSGPTRTKTGRTAWSFGMEVLAPCVCANGRGPSEISTCPDCGGIGSRWTPCGACTVPWNSSYDMERDFAPGKIWEVAYLYATKSHTLYQARLAQTTPRDDVDESACRRDQFRYADKP